MPRFHRRPNDGIEYELLTMTHDSEASRVEEPDTVGKSTAVNTETNSTKAEVGSLSGTNDVAAIPKGTIDPVYEAKARVLNHAVCSLPAIYTRDVNTDILQIQEIGMGKYNWQLFVVVGFGWANDNMWPIVTSLICKSWEHGQPRECRLTSHSETDLK